MGNSINFQLTTSGRPWSARSRISLLPAKSSSAETSMQASATARSSPTSQDPWGSSHTIGSGEKVVDMMTRLNLQAETSYYEHKKYWTWHNHRLGRPHHIDHFLTDGRLGERIYDAKRFVGGAVSDHLPIKLRLRFGHKHSLRKPSRSKDLKVDWKKCLKTQR
jgi:hypothetical protein